MSEEARERDGAEAGTGAVEKRSARNGLRDRGHSGSEPTLALEKAQWLNGLGTASPKILYIVSVERLVCGHLVPSSPQPETANASLPRGLGGGDFFGFQKR